MKQSLTKKKKKKKIISHKQECKKIKEGYLHFYFIKTIFAFFSRHETYLFILVTVRTQFVTIQNDNGFARKQGPKQYHL